MQPSLPDLTAFEGLTDSSIARDLLSLNLEALPPPVAGQRLDPAAPDASTFEHILNLEDILGNCGAFRSMFDGRRCSAAAYGTILDFERVEAVLRGIGLDRFSRRGWFRIVGYFRHNWSLSPVLGLLAATFARAVGLPDPLLRDEPTEAFYGQRELGEISEPAVAA